MKLAPRDRTTRSSFAHLDDSDGAVVTSLVERSPQRPPFSRTHGDRRWCNS